MKYKLGFYIEVEQEGVDAQDAIDRLQINLGQHSQFKGEVIGGLPARKHNENTKGDLHSVDSRVVKVLSLFVKSL